MTDPFSKKPRDADELLLGGGPLHTVWPKVGHSFEGTLIAKDTRQMTSYDTGEPLFWKNRERVTEDTGSPAMYPVLTFQCDPATVNWQGKDYEEVELEDDDGVRVMHVNKPALRDAIVGAVKDAGARKLEIGAHVTVTRVKATRKARPGFGAPHDYKAVWTVPADNPKWPAIEAAMAAAGAEENGPEENPFD